MIDWIDRYKDEIIELTKIIKSWVYVFIILFIIFFLFSPTKIIDPRSSIAIEIFWRVYEYYVSNQYKILFTTPLNVLVFHIEVALYLALIASLPYIMYRIWKYISCALYPKEKRFIYNYVIPFFCMFIIGIIFSLVIFVPLTLKMFFWFIQPSYYVVYFDPHEFLKLVFLLPVSVGIVFTFPVIMKILVDMKVIKPEFWKKHHKTFLFCSMVFSAIITPDGTGITMLILSAILYILYLFGYLISKKGYK